MKLIILDRDGVINEDSDAYIKTPEEWIPIPGSLEAIARLSHADYRIVVATNQSGVGRGLLDIAMLNRIHAKMHRLVQDAGGHIEAVFFCPNQDDSHPWRKPNPGMFEEIGQRLKFNLGAVPVVGDSWRDVLAAQAVGAQPVLVRTGKGEYTLAEGKDLDEIEIYDDLAAVAVALLSRTE